MGPWLSGWIIARMEDDAGYRVIFSISLAFYVVGVVLSFFLRKRKPTGNYNWKEPKQRLSQKGSMWRPLSLSLIAQGIREGVFAFLITVARICSYSTGMEAGTVFTYHLGGIIFQLLGCRKMAQATLSFGGYAVGCRVVGDRAITVIVAYGV